MYLPTVLYQITALENLSTLMPVEEVIAGYFSQPYLRAVRPCTTTRWLNQSKQ